MRRAACGGVGIAQLRHRPCASRQRTFQCHQKQRHNRRAVSLADWIFENCSLQAAVRPMLVISRRAQVHPKRRVPLLWRWHRQQSRRADRDCDHRVTAYTAVLHSEPRAAEQNRRHCGGHARCVHAGASISSCCQDCVQQAVTSGCGPIGAAEDCSLSVQGSKASTRSMRHSFSPSPISPRICPTSSVSAAPVCC